MVTVYSRPNCVQCNATYRLLTNLGIPYEVKDFAASPEAKAAAEEHEFRAAPVVTDGTKWWSGFNPDIIKSLAE